MKQQNEVEKLLSLIFQDGRTKIENGSLLVPPEIAKRFGDQIRKFKPEILLALGRCPICSRELTVKVEEASSGRTGRHAFCQTLGHEDKWEF